MKTIRQISAISLLPLVFCACADELDGELFHKFSYLSQNGWKECKLDIHDDNTASLPIYFGVNGTSGNDNDIHITIDSDPDTLALYNFDRFKNQKELYFTELPKESYTLDKDSYIIPKGELKSKAICSIDLNQIEDIYNEYVLPIKITSSDGEAMGPNKYTKALYNIILQNNFSGSYSGYGTIKEIGTDYTTSISGKQLYAISKNQCYMHAGNISRTNATDYKRYVIILTMTDENTIELSTPNPELNLKPHPVSITRKYTVNTSDTRKYGQETNIIFKYEYKDLTVGSVSSYLCEGTLTMNKEVYKKDYPNVKVEDDE